MNHVRNGACYLVLQAEYVDPVSLEILRPEMRVVFGRDELRGDTHFAAGTRDRALDDAVDAEFAGNFGHRLIRPTIVARRSLRGDTQAAELGQARRELVRNAIDEVILRAVASHVRERKHSERRNRGLWRRRLAVHPPALRRPQGCCEQGQPGNEPRFEPPARGAARYICNRLLAISVGRPCQHRFTCPTGDGLDRRDEPVAVVGHGLDELRCLGGVTESDPQLAYSCV